MARWRWGIGAVGIALLGLGGFYFLTDVSAAQYPGVLLWLAGALIIHDGIGAMAVFAVSVVARRALPFAVLVVVQAALAVTVIVTVLVVPEIVKRALGTANPSILPLDYLRNLLLFYVAIFVVTGVVVAVLTIRRRRAQRSG